MFQYFLDFPSPVMMIHLHRLADIFQGSPPIILGYASVGNPLGNGPVRLVVYRPIYTRFVPPQLFFWLTMNKFDRCTINPRELVLNQLDHYLC